MLHEALVSLFHNQPALAPDLLRRVFGIAAPEAATAVLQDVNLNQVAPTEYRADAVVVLETDRPEFGIVVEVQLREDRHKSTSWPVYVAALRARLRCPVALLVLTPFQDVVAWAAHPIELGPGSVISPQVVGPDLIPVVRTLDEARRNPEMAVLSALAHGNETGPDAIAATVLRAVAELDADRSMIYHDLILSALDGAVRTALEALMNTKYEFQSEFARKYISIGRAEGREEGREAGREEGREAGREEGRRALLGVLQRFLERREVELDTATGSRLAAAPVEVLERIADSAMAEVDAEQILAAIRCELR